MSTWAIKYRYRGTTNGKPVGIVYALNCHDISPRVWSYTKEPHTATQFPTQESAQSEIARHQWAEAIAVKVS